VFDNSIPRLEILARTAIIYAAILIGLRLTGKRAIGQMTAFSRRDLVEVGEVVVAFGESTGRPTVCRAVGACIVHDNELPRYADRKRCACSETAPSEWAG